MLLLLAERVSSVDRSSSIPDEAGKPHTSEEDELVARLRRRDRAAFAVLVAQYQRPMQRLARRLTSNRASAEEVMQELWCSVFRSFHTFEGRASLHAWLTRIVINHAHTIGARETRTRSHELLALDDASAKLPRAALAVEMLAPDYYAHRLIAQELRRLPEKQREVLLLSDILGLSADEVCSSLSLSSVNRRVLLHRARKALARLRDEA